MRNVDAVSVALAHHVHVHGDFRREGDVVVFAVGHDEQRLLHHLLLVLRPDAIADLESAIAKHLVALHALGPLRHHLAVLGDDRHDVFRRHVVVYRNKRAAQHAKFVPGRDAAQLPFEADEVGVDDVALGCLNDLGRHRHLGGVIVRNKIVSRRSQHPLSRDRFHLGPRNHNQTRHTAGAPRHVQLAQTVDADGGRYPCVRRHHMSRNTRNRCCGSFRFIRWCDAAY